MRLLVQGPPSVAIDDRRSARALIKTLNLRGDIEEAFRAQEEPIPGAFDSFGNPKIFIENRVRAARIKPKILTPPFRIKPKRDGDCL